MIKKWNEFLKESLINPDSYLDTRMSEIKSILDSLGNKTIVYYWDNKADRELFISFGVNGFLVNYEFNINNMLVTKLVGEIIDYKKNVDSIDSAITLIQKDINSLLGI